MKRCHAMECIMWPDYFAKGSRCHESAYDNRGGTPASPCVQRSDYSVMRISALCFPSSQFSEIRFSKRAT